MLNQKSRLKYLALMSASVMMMLAMACGGSDDNGGDSPTSTPGSDGENSPTATTESSSSSDLAENRGVVTVGSTRYDFAMDDVFGGIDVCLTLFGVVAGSGKATDGSDVELEFDIPPVDYEGKRGFEDYDPPSIKVEDNVNDHQWAAGGNYSWMTDPPTEDESKVISYTSDGSVAKGTATFIDISELTLFTFGTGEVTERPEPVTGSFEFHCGR